MSFDVIIRWTVIVLYYCVINSLFSECSGEVLVHFDSKHHDSRHKAIKHLKYCKNCPSAKDEGSILSAMQAKHIPSKFDVTGSLVYCLPNYAESSPLNQFDIEENIAFVDRGQISIVEKVTTLQRAGAVGVVIADSGECDNAFKSCGNRIGSASEGGLSAYDFAETWSAIKIPVVIVTKDMAEKLRTLMEVKRRKFPKLGFQLVNILEDDDDEEEDNEEDEEDEEEEDDGHDEL
mmetsp:Transcript_30867/g.57580  ORF Transcript_30867/g.57580 Transcript_30867/m.57580 type:complete len:234 (-) Transcript_30867:313-1014(-)